MLLTRYIDIEDLDLLLAWKEEYKKFVMAVALKNEANETALHEIECELLMRMGNFSKIKPITRKMAQECYSYMEKLAQRKKELKKAKKSAKEKDTEGRKIEKVINRIRKRLSDCDRDWMLEIFE